MLYRFQDWHDCHHIERLFCHTPSATKGVAAQMKSPSDTPQLHLAQVV